jgi:hypothetical protein
MCWCFLQAGANQFGISLGAETLGAFNGSAQSAVDDELRKHSERSRDTEENGIVARLRQTVVLQENTGVCVDIRPGVLGLRDKI